MDEDDTDDLDEANNDFWVPGQIKSQKRQQMEHRFSNFRF
jgi:hypothetical protein